MSPTRIIIIFAICLTVLMIPLLTIYIWWRTLLGSYVGMVENVIAAVISALLITLLLDFTLRRRQEMTLEKVARIGLTEASQKINRMIALFGSIFKAASDGFIPSTIDELFNAKAADLLSLHLALESPAPVLPAITWIEHITRESRLILNELTNIQDRYQTFLPENVLVALGTLRNNTLLITSSQLSSGAELDKQENVPRPVINFTPPETLNYLMSEILSCVKTIQQVSIKLKTSITPHFPNFTFRNNVSPKIGSARFEGKPGVAFIIGGFPVQE